MAVSSFEFFPLCSVTTTGLTRASGQQTVYANARAARDQIDRSAMSQIWNFNTR
jgi:hypothetical protein